MHRPVPCHLPGPHLLLRGRRREAEGLGAASEVPDLVNYPLRHRLPIPGVRHRHAQDRQVHPRKVDLIRTGSCPYQDIQAAPRGPAELLQSVVQIGCRPH